MFIFDFLSLCFLFTLFFFRFHYLFFILSFFHFFIFSFFYFFIFLFFYFLQLGNTAVIWAVSRRQKNVLGQLVDLGADLNVQENVRIYYNKTNKKNKKMIKMKNILESNLVQSKSFYFRFLVDSFIESEVLLFQYKK